ncbi:cytochrome d ubiquinol oxidase subunit II [Bdellovibrio sp. NC01]|uniref:cytochrome d ubiquinol oxidase subunit II n=1 Tax=Bdellovibrio sp. NC01 TaxID=2220073 RepID=UPI001157CB92|nr:cytochrome d ubiquinol oxidase subunit II [Bdellovibrio sp. NC01]QDK38943.1 cytochrome d ubiquinol oxidase subunit II [Bdellovibrio sp. NC01]
MIEILLFFIAASLLLYVVLGGADYGAGILELLPSGKFKDEQRRVINHAMGPVWEANHMWLILVIVILFMAFPTIFNTIMTYLHLPVVALLVGIVVRGTAFTFRHYDAIHDEKSQKIYSRLFGISSLWSAMWIGIIAGSLGRGTINMETRDFVEAYIHSWWGWLPLMMGFFTVSIFGFLASVYLVGETKDPELKKLFWKRGYYFNIAVIATGGLVFFASWLENASFFLNFLTNPFALAILGMATAAFFALWYFVRRSKSLIVRIIAAAQASLILLGWYVAEAPNAVITKQGAITFYQAAAPAATLTQLTIALLVGSVLIFPSLAMLLKVFKIR